MGISRKKTLKKYKKNKRITRKHKGGGIPVLDIEIIENQEDYKEFHAWEKNTLRSLPRGSEEITNTSNIDVFLKNLKEAGNPFYDKYLFLHEHNIPFKSSITHSSYHNFNDVFAIDTMFFQEKWLSRWDTNKPADIEYKVVIVKNEDNSYGGSIWCFWRPGFPYLGMYGIRTSLFNYLTNKPGTASKILKAVEDLAHELGKTAIVVPHPLPKMQLILEKKGFLLHIPARNTKTEELNFLYHVARPDFYLVKPLTTNITQ